ncbi:MAG TPA: cysteine-rich CWC family protein [Hanamia sp.]
MTKHEEKICPRCTAQFVCKVSDAVNCQCYGIRLSANEEGFVKANYDDCLCRNCLLQLKNRYSFFTEQKELYINR